MSFRVLVSCGRVFTARDATRSQTQQNWKAGNEVWAWATVSSTEILAFQWLRAAEAEASIEILTLVQ